MNEEFGISPYRVQSREDVDCACARYDCDGSFGSLGSSSDSEASANVFRRTTNSSRHAAERCLSILYFYVSRVFNIHYGRFESRFSKPLLLSLAPQDKAVLALGYTQHGLSPEPV